MILNTWQSKSWISDLMMKVGVWWNKWSEVFEAFLVTSPNVIEFTGGPTIFTVDVAFLLSKETAFFAPGFLIVPLSLYFDGYAG